MVNRGLRGVGVNAEGLALDVISDVAHHGNYLSTEHTLRNFRRELFLPSFLDRRSSGERKEEELEILEKARSRAKEILATHQPKPLTPEVEEKMEQVLQKALKDFKQGGS